MLANLQPLGPTSQDQPLQLAFALKLHNESDLETLLAAQNDPTSALYHHYLTPQEFNNQFAPTQGDVNTVTAYLRQQGFKVTAIASNHLLIDASAPVATAERAFAITFNNYQLKTRVVYAPNDNPLLPEAIENQLETVIGLNNVTVYHPINLQSKLKQLPAYKGLGGGFTPEELRNAYDVKPLLSAGRDGTGQTIGLFEMDGYKAGDIAAYRQQYKLGTLKASNVLVDGATNTPGAGAIEVTLDMEVISAMTPGATQKIYIGPNTTAGISDTYNRIVTDNQVKIISISWGDCELASSKSRLGVLDTIFEQGAAQGQTFFAASGDNGAYDCATDASHSLAVDSPASDPYVVGVGGTTLNADPNGAYGSETAWSGVSGGTSVGGGGGRSIYFTHPTYQSGPNLTDPNRQVPDISANADPNTGYSIYYTSGNTTTPGWITVGGTSAAAPLWAGIATDINQMLVADKVAPLGHATAAIYRLYNTPQVYPPYHDITTGSNLYYKAGPGYDMATGIGTPDAWNIARDLENSPVLATQLLQNAGFDTGPASWVEHSSGGYELISTANPHSGKYSTYFCSYVNCHDSITQTAYLSKFTRKVTLSYWVYIGRGDTSTTCQDNFQVFLRTAGGDSITRLQKLCNMDANGWVQYSFDVTNALAKYAGQTIQLDFEATGTSGPRSNFFVNLDDVDFQSLVVVPGITTQVIQNPGFENGHAPWQEYSRSGYELISTVLAHTGLHSAYLCGYANCHDTISQTVTLPTSTRNVVLSYWIYIGHSTITDTCADTFHSYAQLPAAQGTTIANFQTLCNTDANGWIHYSLDITNALASALGKPIQIGFEAAGSSDPRTNFFVDVDDVTLYVTHG
ncbi:hypothetical protein KDK_39720 [Dictyobacter kobayashii]|uniref:Peptidase S53 domain-containing protein n=1 Tax=Dictyobacter kobayashii TaxID=2014872 RepID=A0A402AM14_9CHLR|nr:hypothetical protein KDK_39720 [Dictyobacter kobayashii]